MKKKKNKTLNMGPVFIIMIMMMVVSGLSLVCNLFQVRADQTEIVVNSLETSVISVKNFLSPSGIKYFFSSAIDNLSVFEPLFLLIVSLIGIGIGEKSGLFKAMFDPFKKVKTGVVTVVVLMFSMLCVFLGDNTFAFLLPFIGVVYKYLGKNPMLGIITCFIGLSAGYGSGIFVNNDILQLGQLTQSSARVEVDSDYIFSMTSYLNIMVTAFVIMVISCYAFIHKLILPKLPHVKKDIEEDLIVDRTALMYSNFTFMIIVIILIYTLIPGLFGSGILLDKSADSYVAALLGVNSPFKKSYIYIVTIILMICGYIYGKTSGNIKNSNEYSTGLSKSFDNLGYVFVLIFFTSQLISILNWANLGNVLASGMINFLSGMQFSGVALIVIMFIIIFLVGLIIPSTIDKWILASPVIVPLFMRSNISPEFTQYIFMVASGLSKAITPVFPYFIILVAFLEKYDTNEKTKTTIFGTIKMILPVMLILTGIWILILVGWFTIGLPLGIDGSITL